MTSNRNLALAIRDCTQRAAVVRGCDIDGQYRYEQYGQYWYWFNAGVPAVDS